jgi:hypothetical protein
VPGSGTLEAICSAKSVEGGRGMDNIKECVLVGISANRASIETGISDIGESVCSRIRQDRSHECGCVEENDSWWKAIGMPEIPF